MGGDINRVCAEACHSLDVGGIEVDATMWVHRGIERFG